VSLRDLLASAFQVAGTVDKHYTQVNYNILNVFANNIEPITITEHSFPQS
jgi:hypothetical protein